MSRNTWAGDPDYRTASTPAQVPSGASQIRRHGIARRAVMRALIGAGAKPVENRDGDDWDVENLPLGGRVKVTGAMNRNRRLSTLAWVRQHAERRHWSAVVWLNWGAHYAGREEMTAQMPLEDFALVVGRLAWLERDRKRWLDSAPDSHPGSDGGR